MWHEVSTCMEESLLGWYDYVEHIADDWLAKKIYSSSVEAPKMRGRLWKR